jgi:hypothetical protein
MGVYYHFFNISRNNEQNVQVINGNLCHFVTKFDKYTENEQKEIFEKCIKLNGWSDTDIILAVPDYYNHDVFKYTCGKIERDNDLKDNYFESK